MTYAALVVETAQAIHELFVPRAPSLSALECGMPLHADNTPGPFVQNPALGVEHHGLGVYHEALGRWKGVLRTDELKSFPETIKVCQETILAAKSAPKEW